MNGIIYFRSIFLRSKPQKKGKSGVWRVESKSSFFYEIRSINVSRLKLRSHD